jgi:hypothetical protein
MKCFSTEKLMLNVKTHYKYGDLLFEDQKRNAMVVNQEF